MKTNLLIVEDDPSIKNLITTAVEIQGYAYDTAGNGTQAIMTALSKKPDIMLLDLGLPDIDGIEVIQKVRSWSRMPIIVITARSEDSDKIEALDAGADDYLTKPFSVDELLARIRVALRRLAYYDEAGNKESSVFENGALKIDYVSRSVFLEEEEIHLTPMEYKLLCLLAKNAGKVLTHTYITQEIWGSAFDSDIVSLRVFMATLRKKIEPQEDSVKYIQTHIGIGYRMLTVVKK